MPTDPSSRLHRIWQRIKALGPEDVPESEEGLARLLENVARLFEAYEHSPAGYLQLDRRGRIISSNLTFCSMVGGARAELVDRPCFDFVIREHRDRLYLHLRKLFKTGSPAHCELQLNCAGKPFWVRFDSICEYGRLGRQSARTTVIDISDHKVAVDALERLAAIVEAADDAILRMGLDGVITAWNPAAQRIYGFSAREALGRHAGELLNPADREGEVGRLIALLRRGQKVRGYNTTRRHRDGGELRIVLTMSPIADEKGEMVAVSSIERDATGEYRRDERMREVNEQLQLAAEASEIGVWNYDLASGTSKWNEQLYHLLGLEPREGPEEGERFFEFIHPEDRTGSLANFEAVLAGSDGIIEVEFRVVRADGEIRWLAARGRIYRNEGGEPVRISGINYDVTRRKRSEETIRLAQLQLAAQLSESERANEELAQYAYAVSHDLKSPLRAIRNYAQFLYEDLAGSLTGEQKKYLEGLKTAVDQGDALIGDLLSFSRLDGIVLEKEAADVPDIVSEVRAMLDLPSEVEISVAPKWPDFTADRILLRQILHNLIANGVKFNQRTPKRIEIGWRPAPGDRIELHVRDNGIGIEPQYREQIFRIFQRLHTDRRYEGTGIGLAIVQKAAQKLGGSVRVTSEPGQGSTFYVQLPRDMQN